jgi:hypothetical protein
MKKHFIFSAISIFAVSLSACNTVVHHADSFYNDDGSNAFPYVQFPLIKPYYVYRSRSSSPWMVDLHTLWVNVTPNEWYHYEVGDLNKLSVKDDVIMLYSSHISEQAPSSIQDNYYHWFVIIPDQDITMGFHDEAKFQAYIQDLGIQNPDWQTPDEAYKKFEKTGCLDWIPDCK